MTLSFLRPWISRERSRVTDSLPISSARQSRSSAEQLYFLAGGRRGRLFTSRPSKHRRSQRSSTSRVLLSPFRARAPHVVELRPVRIGKLGPQPTPPLGN